MKKFDVQSIKERLVSRLSSSGYWNRILQDSAISALLDAVAEQDAETFRYLEYLLQEAKWNYARNITSVLSMASLFGYKPSRKTAAMGEIIVSHDPVLQGAGSLVFDYNIDSMLSPYQGGDIIINEGTEFATSDGSKRFISVEKVIYKTGNKYVKIPVVQGFIKYFETKSLAQGLPFERVRIEDSSVEALANNLTQKFFKVYVYPNGNSSSESFPVKIVDNIILADENEYACDVKTSYNFNFIELRFGDGYSGKMLPKGAKITIQYLSTLGKEGNVNEKYVVNKINSVISTAISFFCSNFSPIMGGREHDTIEEIKAKAPKQYLIEGSIVTENSYKYLIESIPYVYKATVYSGTFLDISTNIVKDSVLFSAIDNTGKIPQRDRISSDFQLLSKGKKSPLDIVRYEEPRVLRLGINVNATLTTNENLNSKAYEIKEKIYNKYNIFNQEFEGSFDTSEFISYIRSLGKDDSGKDTLKNIEFLLEAIEYLKPSTFRQANIDYFSKSFVFDKSYKKMKYFNDGVLYCLKIDVIFNCPACEEKSRTLFLIYNEDYDPNNPLSLPYKIKQYPLITNITNYSYMSNFVLNPAALPSEIPSLINGQTNPDYIKFEVNYLGYLNDIDNLGGGVLYIPIYQTNVDGSAGDIYINFFATNKDELDNTVSIKVYTIPFYGNLGVTSYYKNNIIDIHLEDIKIELQSGS